MKSLNSKLASVLLFATVFLVGAGCNEESAPKQDPPRQPANPVAAKYLIKAQQLSRAGDYYSALALTDSAKRYAPKLTDAHFMEGRIYTELRRFDQAEEAYKRALSLAPQYQGAWFNMGNNAFRQEEFEKALRYYRKEQKTHSSAAVFFHMGRAYAELGKADSARQALKQVLAADSSYAAAYNRLGELYEQEGELNKALSYAQRALQQESENANYRYRVGALLLRTGREKGALKYLRNVVKQHSWHYGAHYNMGQALMRMGREKEAKRYLAEADSLEELQAEIEKLQSLASMNPYQTMRWVKLGNTLHEAGRIDDAVEVYEIALAQAPQNLSLRNNLAILKAKQGNLQSAVAQYRAILQRDSSYADVWFNLGIAYARLGSEAEARKAWQNVLKYKPDHAATKEYLARLAKNGD